MAEPTSLTAAERIKELNKFLLAPEEGGASLGGMSPESENVSDAPSRPLPAARRWLALAGLGLTVYLVATASWRKGLPAWWSGKSVKLADVVQGASWWGGLLALGLVLALFLTAGHWARVQQAAAPAPAPPRAPRWFAATVLAIMVLGAGLRAPRLGLSLYNDECHVFRAQLCGSVPKAHLGNAEKFRPLSWMHTLYENRTGNNAMPFSLLARSSYDLWRKFTKSPPGLVNETALRLPVLICGVLSIGAMALLGLRLGGSGMGLAAALLTALHPWHMRYSAEARPYGLLLLVLPLLFLALNRAWRTGRWRDWLGFGFMEYLTVACFMAATHFLLALNLAVAAAALLPLLRKENAGSAGIPPRRILLPQAVVGVLAAALFLAVNFPLFVQLSKVLADPDFFHSPHPFDSAWFRDVGSFLGFGIPAAGLDPASPAQPSMHSLMAGGGSQMIAASGLGGLIILLLAGFRRLWRQGGTGRFLCLANIGGALITLIYCQIKGLVFLKWYSLFLLPGVLALTAAGIASLSLNKRRPWGWLAALPLLACWLPGLNFYRDHPRENLRAVVEAARQARYPEALKNPANTLLASLWSESPVYDPSILPLRDRSELDSLITRARAEKRELYVEFGFRSTVAGLPGGLLEELENPAVFGLAGKFPGLDEDDYCHWLYRLKPEK